MTSASLSRPLLTLNLSSPAFLDSVLTDSGSPLYAVETFGSTSSLSRCDPDGRTHVAAVRWPQMIPSSDRVTSTQVQIGTKVYKEEEYLKSSVLSSSRKFHVPGHSHSLKWKRVLNRYHCNSTTGSHPLIAIFEPAVLSSSRLHVFVSSLHREDSKHAQRQHGGVSIPLLDHLVLSCLLLTTNPDEWRCIAAPSPYTLEPLEARSIPIRTPSPCPSSPVSPVSTRPSSPMTASSHASSLPMTPRSPSSMVSYTASPVSLYPTAMQGYISPLTLASPLLPPPRPLPTPAQQRHVVANEWKTEEAQQEPPPPYEQIEWTIRLKAPRRRS